MLINKRLSILGDSISTYKGVSNDASANPSLKYNPYYYGEPMPKDRTYWHRVMDSLGLVLCVNNSYSGGNLSGRDNPDSGINRARNLSRADGDTPDIVIVFMGINDLGRGVDAEEFASDYKATLTTIKHLYPTAAVCCVNLPDRDASVRQRTELFNEGISAAVKSAGEGFFIADLFGSRLKGDFYYMNTTDGLHPDEDGMRIIAEVVEEAIRKKCGR